MLKSLVRDEEAGDDLPLLNTRVLPYIRIINGALDEDENSTSGLILNGRLDPYTLHFLKVDEYQRALGDRPDIYTALKEGRVVPNIEVGIRGQDFTTEGDDYIIRSPAFIIDGWQRIGTARRLLEAIPDHPIRIFASIHFGTSPEWERHRFTELNKNVKRISPNLHLRNMRDQNSAVLKLYNISTTDRSFALYKKISWQQNAQRGELMSALTFAKTVAYLHSHRANILGSSVERVSEGLARVQQAVTPATFQRNVYAFFNLIDTCWPMSGIEYRQQAPQIKATFLTELARLLSRHVTFWEHNDNTLAISADDRRKLAKFPLNDPQVMQLAGTGGAARQILYRLLVDHMNSGRRTQRLRDRYED